MTGFKISIRYILYLFFGQTATENIIVDVFLYTDKQ